MCSEMRPDKEGFYSPWFRVWEAIGMFLRKKMIRVYLSQSSH